MATAENVEWPAGHQLLMSSWDHHVHVFPEAEELNAVAICGHTAATSRLIKPLPNARMCLACLLVRAEQTWNGGA